MKKLYLIGNMKMNMNYSELEPYFANITQIAEKSDNVVGICLPSVYIDYAKYSLENSKVLYGAQNMYYEDKGAFTGEVSAHMLNDFNCDLVIIGHSERRNLFHESDEEINLKVKKALDEGITPILCFGELKEEREGGMAYNVVERQLLEDLKDLTEEEVARIIFAYEPVWAIGTGLSATPEQAEEMIAFAKRTIEENFDCKEVIVLYGGSLKASNAQEILSKPHIDGGLIGGACLKINEFEEIINTKVE